MLPYPFGKGAIRGLTGAMRRFAQVVDDLELLDIPLQGGVASWSGGRNIKFGLHWTGF